MLLQPPCVIWLYTRMSLRFRFASGNVTPLTSTAHVPMLLQPPCVIWLYTRLLCHELLSEMDHVIVAKIRRNLLLRNAPRFARSSWLRLLCCQLLPEVRS